jgi:hypothetical protein
VGHPAAVSRERRFVQVDVFTDRLFGGNPLAVVLDGAGLAVVPVLEGRLHLP